MDFDSIYQTYFKDVYFYMCSISRSESIAEDITQETFVKALKSLDSFDGQNDIRAWLFTIAKNSYYSYCKRRKIYVDAEPLEDTPDVTSDFTCEIADDETAFQIHRFLHEMNEPYKEVFTLRIFGELPFEKIALLFGKSPGWARVVFYRAKLQIAKYMEELYDGKN